MGAGRDSSFQRESCDLLVQVMDRQTFLAAFERWTNAPFPQGSDDDVLDEIHAQLAYADAMVAEAALPIANSRALTGEVPHQVRVELRDAVTRSAAYMLGEVEDQARSAASYRDYAEILLAVIDALD